MDSTNRITRFVEKPPPGQAPSNLGNAGTWLFDPEVLEHIPDQKMDGSIERLVMPGLIAEGRLVLGFPSDAYWMDLGTPERYMQIHRDLLGGLLPTWLSAESLAGPMLGEGVRSLAGRHHRRAGRAGTPLPRGRPGAHHGPSVLGDDCAVREHATIERSVLWNDVRIGANAIVRDSIIGAGCWIGDDAVVENAVLANGAKVQRGVRLAAGARLEPDEVAS